jgi:hypothetical protein
MANVDYKENAVATGTVNLASVERKATQDRQAAMVAMAKMARRAPWVR